LATKYTTLDGYNICRQAKLYLQVAGGAMTFVLGWHTSKRVKRGLKFTREAGYCLRKTCNTWTRVLYLTVLTTTKTES